MTSMTLSLDQIKAAVPWGVRELISPEAIHAALSEPWRECPGCEGGVVRKQLPWLRLSPCPACNGTGKFDQHSELRAFIVHRPLHSLPSRRAGWSHDFDELEREVQNREAQIAELREALASICSQSYFPADADARVAWASQVFEKARAALNAVRSHDHDKDDDD